MKIVAILLVFLVAYSYAITININTSDAPGLKDFGKRVKTTLKNWYPKVVKALKSPTFRPVKNIQVYFDPNYNGVAYASGTRIVGSVNYYRNNKDIGSMVHEMAHVIQQYQGCAGWVTEGIADYIRYWKFQPNKKPGRPQPGSHYSNGYGVSAYFLNWINVRHKGTIVKLNRKCREGSYNDGAFKQITGKNVDTLWRNMMNKETDEMAENYISDDSAVTDEEYYDEDESDESETLESESDESETLESESDEDETLESKSDEDETLESNSDEDETDENDDDDSFEYNYPY